MDRKEVPQMTDETINNPEPSAWEDIERRLDGCIRYISSSEIPNIDLYMDQVTTFMEQHLSDSRRKDGDKILTKTMINNYAKSGLLPSPEKKKYTKDHMVLLMCIYTLKEMLSITDIQTLFCMMNEEYFGNTEELGLCEIYDRIVEASGNSFASTKADIIEKKNMAEDMFRNDSEYLKKFAFISMLGYDISVRQHLIEQMIDEIAADRELEILREKEAEQQARQDQKNRKAAEKEAKKQSRD